MTLFDSPEALLTRILVVLGIAIGMILLAAFVTVVVQGSILRKEAELLEAAKREIVEALAANTLSSLAIDRLTLDQQLKLLTKLTPLIASDELLRIRSLLRDSELIDEARQLTRSLFWTRRLRGLRILTMLAAPVEPQPSWFSDRHLEIRAQAAEWVAASRRTDAIPFLIGMVSDPVGLCRFTVQDSLQRLAGESELLLAAFLEKHKGTRVIPVLEIASTFRSSAFGTAVERHTHDTDPKVRALAAASLGNFAAESIQAPLVQLLSDPSAEVRAAAARSIGRAKLWTLASHLKDSLRDPSFMVRRDSAYALLACGAPGQVLLRASLGSDDRFARDIAQQAIDVGKLRRYD